MNSVNRTRSANRTKYIFITGGVVSSLGKGIVSSSIGLLLKKRGYNVTIKKLDPYLNIDPGTMSPYQHGEVYVTNDGAETDLDLGHYERFIDENMTKFNNTTSGQVYHEVIRKEREGDYLGGTVQVIPHVTEEIKTRITRQAPDGGKYDIIICEVGGTVGDIESLPFLEAIRQMSLELPRYQVLFIHLTLVPYIAAAQELKTKPTQHSVKLLREIGIQADILICRSEVELDSDVKKKIALFCNVAPREVISDTDVSTIYEIPLVLKKEDLGRLITEKLRLSNRKADLSDWADFVEKVKNPSQSVNIAIVGKYVKLGDAYKSISEAFIHGGAMNDARVKLHYISSEELSDENVTESLKDMQGILIPGGFGERGVDGKVAAIRFARENNIPFFGICLGMQLAIVEYARNVCKMRSANSTEFKISRYPVVALMKSQVDVKVMGATMRLGAYEAKLEKNSLAHKIYDAELISERHRHRYEVNNKFRQILIDKGMTISGINERLNLVEVVELKSHPWFLGCQFHPELKSRVANPHPLFVDFVRAALEVKKEAE